MWSTIHYSSTLKKNAKNSLHRAWGSKMKAKPGKNNGKGYYCMQHSASSLASRVKVVDFSTNDWLTDISLKIIDSDLIKIWGVSIFCTYFWTIFVYLLKFVASHFRLNFKSFRRDSFIHTFPRKSKNLYIFENPWSNHWFYYRTKVY